MTAERWVAEMEFSVGAEERAAALGQGAGRRVIFSGAEVQQKQQRQGQCRQIRGGRHLVPAPRGRRRLHCLGVARKRDPRTMAGKARRAKGARTAMSPSQVGTCKCAPTLSFAAVALRMNVNHEHFGSQTTWHMTIDMALSTVMCPLRRVACADGMLRGMC